MIKTKEDLKRYLEDDKARTEVGNKVRWIRGILCSEPYYVIWQYVKAMRKEEYHTNQKGVFHKCMHYVWRRRRNRLGERTSIFVEPGVFEEGLMIWHPGIVVNARAVVGKNCTLHGQNCIGNDGQSDDAPILGNHVSLGVGASVIGAVKLADGITVGAGAVVLHSFEEPGITIGGIPARKISDGKARGK